MIKSISTEYCKLLFFTIVTCFIAYGFTLTNFTLTIDSEQPFYADASLVLGRWGTNLFRFHIFGGIIPYFTLLLGLIFYSLAAVEMSRLFKLNTVQSFIFCGLLVTFPQMAYQFVFTMQADAVGFGFFLSVLSVRYFLKSLKHSPYTSSLINFIFAALLYMFVIGIYQALALIPIVLYIITVFQATYDDDYLFKKELRKTLFFCAYVIASGILYVISVKILAPQAGGGGYLSSYTSGGFDNLFTNFLKLWGTHLGGNAYYGNKTFVVALLVSVLLLISFLINAKKLAVRVVLLLTILMVPFLIAFFITSGYTPPRLYVTSGIVLAFLVVHLLSLIPAERLVGIVAFFIIVVNIYFITMLFWSQNKVYNHDINIARDINTSIKAKYPDFNPKSDYVYFFGSLPWAEHDRYRLPDSEVFGGSFFLWDNGSNYRIIHFMEWADIAHYRVIDNKETYLAIKDSIATMPVWPEEGYIKRVNNVIVVKLGDTKGAPLWIE